MLYSGNKLVKQLSLFFFFWLITGLASAQQSDTINRIFHFNGAVTVTNNGFSFIPAFTLGKPAAIVNLYVGGGKRFSFEPEFRYSLAGKPWSFIFIWRYKLIKKENFQLTVGTHLPALSFITGPVIKNGVEQEAIQARRFFPVIELSPNFLFTKNVSAGVFYQYGYGIEEELPQHMHFLSARTNITNIVLSKDFYLRFNPQFYYLKMDEQDGIYFAAGAFIAHRKFPLALGSLINKAIQSNIPGKDFDWNVSLIYSFANTFVRK